MTEGIPPFLDRRKLVYTYTNLNAYRNICPHQMFRRYIKKDIPYVETPEMAWGNQVHEAFELRVGSNKPLPDKMRQWESFATPFDPKRSQIKCEQKLGCTSKPEPTGFFSRDKVWLRGKLDLVVEQGTTAYLNDWKTGNSKFEDPFELEIGALLLKINKPNLTKIVGQYTWLKENRAGQMYDLSNFRGTWDKVNEIVKAIENDSSAEDGFAKKKSGLCGRCSVEDCENWRERK